MHADASRLRQAQIKYQRWQDRRGQFRPVVPPESESLEELTARCLPVWEKEIVDDLLEGRNVLVVAHGNSIRAIVQVGAWVEGGIDWD